MRCWHWQGPNWTCLESKCNKYQLCMMTVKTIPVYAMKNKIIVFLWIFTLLQNDLWKLLMIDAYSVANWTTPQNMNRKNGKNLQDSKDANLNRKIRFSSFVYDKFFSNSKSIHLFHFCIIFHQERSRNRVTLHSH